MALAQRNSVHNMNTSDGGHLIDSDDSSSSGHTSEDEDGGEDADGHPMMSIFASYYGITDPAAAQVDNTPKGTIDDAGFQAQDFVKNMLVNEPFETLVKQDTEMVQEIRTLDGEMQKLVYDNYNKFITATETIKEMKNDVYGMDPDMDAVRLKMEQIAQGSQALDSVLHPTRCKVDKLVRVRRLLDRLGFLNELPERLEVMITHRHYKEAVQLYNKTIMVLTRHQHVLSFKKIKERTELMMKDLTGKVIDMLEDTNLEAVKLTQYVSVLRLMNAPTQQVSNKLLAAHKQRSLRMINQFKVSLSNSKAVNSYLAGGKEPTSSETASTLQDALQHNTKLDDIANARQFHQSMMVGLIEACKGMIELYSAHSSEGAHAALPSTQLAHQQQKKPNGDDEEDSDGISDAEAALQAQLTATAQALEAHSQEAIQGYEALVQVICSVMGEYSKSVLQAFQMFFKKYQTQYLSRSIEYCDVDDIKAEYAAEIKQVIALANTCTPAGSAANSVHGFVGAEDKTDGQEAEGEEGSNQYRSFDLNEEYNSWVLLARQAVVDVMFLDSNQLECQLKLHRATHNSTTITTGHSVSFAQQLTAVLTAHCDVIQQHKLNCYLNSVHRWLPSVTAFCNIKASPVLSTSTATSSASGTLGTANSAESTHGTEEERRRRSSVDHTPSTTTGTSTNKTRYASHSTAPDPAVNLHDRAVLKRHTLLVKQIMSLLQRSAVHLFSDCSKDIKCVVDICEITSGDTSAIVLSQISKFCNKLASGMENLACVTNNRCTYDCVTNTLTFLGAQEGNNNGSASPTNAEKGEDVQIYVDLSVISPPQSLPNSPMHKGAPASSSPLLPEGSAAGLKTISTDVDHEGLVQTPLRLLLTALLCNMLTSVMPQLNEELRLLELPTAEGNRAFQMQCMSRLELCCQLLLKAFIDANARYASTLYADAQHAVNVANYAQLSATAPSAGKSVEISETLLYLSRMFDKMALLGCLVFGELPAHNNKAALKSAEIMQRRASGRPASALEADMDRLFSKKVTIFGPVSLGDSTEVVLNTVLKASFKAALEAVRCMTLPYQSYVHIQANCLLLKQVAGNLLRDTSECDNLADQILSTVFGRYVGANDISNASDANEVTLINRSITDAFTHLSSSTVLIL
eukprot:CAMPEP_0184980700 /NCGR_PEP_ID=MMETSP1098-20130426/10625_1 /TAXON_ID=89044 /ORGANISM="Spumella elongata, Strain CCAP 955/1" /LENGTH=1140 /DNA_ID=CAMNT_0027504173 /DNA_START=24 /DNA_END=3442 /DNA_ORIENTATION=+